MMDVLEQLEASRGVCVGLDPHPDRLPSAVFAALDVPERALTSWACGVLEAVAPHVCCVKPQIAMFERFGSAGLAAVEALCKHARVLGVPILLDAKRGDIGSTAEAYAHALLDDDGPIGADALTVSPYLGPESLAPFMKRVEQGKMLFVLLRTSNPGAGRWQRAIAPQIAAWVQEQNRLLGSPRIGVVVGATVAEAWREQLPAAWFLAPGVGAQGASVADLQPHRRSDGAGVLPTASRSVLFGEQPREGNRWEQSVEARAARFAAEWASCY